jgi:hypothetical protein
MISATTISPLNRRIVDGAPSFVGLLDTYPNAAAAYSVRRLSSTYNGSLMQVRIDTVGQPVYDIGFDANGDLDTADLISKAAGNDAFVRTWYDQSGNVNDAQNPTSSLQPQIVSSGSILTLGTAAKPCLNFNNDYLDTPSQTDIIGRLDYYATYNVTSYGAAGTILLGSTTSSAFYFQHAGGNYLNNTTTITAIAMNDSVQRLINPYADTVARVGFNDTTYSSGLLNKEINSTSRVFRIGAYPAGGSWNFIGNLQEIVIYSGNQLGKAGIKSNINSYYSIYP